MKREEGKGEKCRNREMETGESKEEGLNRMD